MSIYLMCLHNGTPVFNKKRGENIENVKFIILKKLEPIKNSF